MSSKTNRNLSKDSGALIRKSSSKDATPSSSLLQEENLSVPKRRRSKKHKQKLFPHSFDNRKSVIDNVMIKMKDRPAIDVLSSDDTQGLVNLGCMMIVGYHFI